MATSETIIAIVENESGVKGLGLETRLDSLDMDSLEFVELITRIEDEMKVLIPDYEWAKLNSIADLVIQVGGKLACQ